MYPDNEISKYKTKQSRPLILKGNWKVGLIEFHYLRTWETFRDVDGIFFLIDKKIYKYQVVSDYFVICEKTPRGKAQLAHKEKQSS